MQVPAPFEYERASSVENVFVDVEREEQAAAEGQGALEDDAHLPASGVELGVGHAGEIASLDSHGSLRGPHQADDVLDREGLPGARRAQETRDLAARHGQVHLVEDPLAAGLGDDADELDCRFALRGHLNLRSGPGDWFPRTRAFRAFR